MKYVVIQLKDLCYYEDDFEYDPFIVEKDDKFEENYKRLVELCQGYDDFEEVEQFVRDNFTKLDYEKRIINL